MAKVAYKYWPYTKEKVKVKVRSNKVAKSKYSLSVVWHMFYGSFGTQNSMTFIFKFDPRKGQFQVKLGQIWSNFKIPFFLQKFACLVQFCLRIKKRRLFLCTTIINAKITFQNVTSSPLHGFWPLHSQKTKILLWNFVCLLFVCISIIYIPVSWITWKFRIL